ncbi:50S ribosomal subunit protein L10 [Candidatus Vidania fulgoroideae]|nr:50S ribosomal subunit protein L10 [Candidatus Vidania fulgoroideae]
MNKSKYIDFFRDKLFKSSFFIVRYNAIKNKHIRDFRISCEKNECKALFIKNSLLNIFLKKKKINYKSRYNNFILLLNDFFKFKKTAYLKLPKKKIKALFYYQNKKIIFKRDIKNLLKKGSKKKIILSFFKEIKKKIFLFLKFLLFLKNENK